MKTNISGLMNTISSLENEFSSLICSMKGHVYNTSIQELDGRVNVIEDYEKDFNREMKEHMIILDKISKLKATLYEKNNTFKLSDGRCIQQAIVDNSNLRKVKAFYDTILSYRSTKKRVTEVTNSYFECKTLNFDVDDIRHKSKQLEAQIQKTDFEISKLNSIEFDIDI
jgi:hypothetical protein